MEERTTADFRRVVQPSHSLWCRRGYLAQWCSGAVGTACSEGGADVNVRTPGHRALSRAFGGSEHDKNSREKILDETFARFSESGRSAESACSRRQE
jgi:hypothetical protein